MIYVILIQITNFSKQPGQTERMLLN